jgi:hypothetical protein
MRGEENLGRQKNEMGPGTCAGARGSRCFGYLEVRW